MKNLSMLILLTSLTSCSSSLSTIITNPDTLKFKAGDAVKTTTPFYSACIGGNIVGYTPAYDAKEGPAYNVILYCPGILEMPAVPVILLESTLIKL